MLVTRMRPILFAKHVSFAGDSLVDRSEAYCHPHFRDTGNDGRRGVTFEEYDMPGLKTVDGIATTLGGRAAWFKDTEGNTIGLIRLRS